MNGIEKEIKKYKSFSFMTLLEFFKIWDFDKNSKIALIEDGEKTPIYIGLAYKVPIVFAERRIIRFTYPEEKAPIIYLKKPDETIKEFEFNVWRDWIKDEKLF